MTAHTKAPTRSTPKQSTPGKNKAMALPAAVTVGSNPLQTAARPSAACACGGDCPRCRPRRRTALDTLGLSGPGEALPETLRGEFRLRTGHDPLGVRLHTDARAAATARRFQANAFTFGSHIVFGSGRFAPNTRKGRRLLFHELIHVIQQQGAQENAAAPAVSTDRALEIEAHRAGPGPVLGRLRQRAIQKEDEVDAAPAPILGEGEHFRWIGPNEAPTIVVSTAWLRSLRVSRTATEILGSRSPQVLRPIIMDLVPRYPWATPERAERGIPTAFLSNIVSTDWDLPEMRFVLGTNIFLFLGLPPDRPVQVFGSETGLQCYIDMSTFYGGDVASASLSADAREAGKNQATQALLIALEDTVEAPLDPIASAELERLLPARLPDTPSVHRLDLTEDAPIQLFGESAWREFIDAHPIDDTTPGAIIDLGGSSFRASPQLTPEDLEFAQRILREIFGEPLSDAPPPENPQYLSQADLLALRALDQHADRAEIIDQFRRARELGGEGDDRASLRDLIETAAAIVDWEHAESSTNFTAASGDDGEIPIVPRPVRGQITNPDRLVPGMEAQFRFRTLDTVDEFRVSHVHIHWEAWRVETASDGTVTRTFIDDDSTNYIETRAESLINERTFDLTFATEGDYEIHAFVDHNFYLPAHFMTMVRVKTESARADETRAASADAFGYETAIDDEYRFTEIDDEEFYTGIAIGGPLVGLAMSEFSEGYEQGSRAEGSLVERVANDATFAFEQRLAELDAELARLDASILALSGTGNSDVVEYLRERRDRLTAARDRVRDIYGTPDTTAPVTYGVATQSFFISRRSGVRNTRLRLLCWYTLTGSGESEEFLLHLIDQTELTETEHYEFDVQTADFEAGMRYLFLELGRSYPDGTLSFGFQVHTHEEGATNRLVRYERVTDTLNTDMRDVVFSTGVNLTVNLVALLLTLFPPTTAIGITLGLAYNAASLAATHGEDLRTGTLHGDRLALDLGMLALDLIPALGRLTGRFTIGTVVYRTMEISQYAGMAVMISDDGFRALTHLRDTQMTELADLQQRIRDLEDVNASSPELDSLREQERELIVETRAAAIDVFGELALTQGLILGSTMMIGHVAEPYLTTPRAAPDAPPARPHVDGDAITPHPRSDIEDTVMPRSEGDETLLPAPRETAENPGPARETTEPTIPPTSPDDTAERSAAGRGHPPAGSPPPPGPPATAADHARSRERLLDMFEGIAVLPPPLPREAVVNPVPDNSTFARGHFTPEEAYQRYNQAIGVSTGREVAIFQHPGTGEYLIRIGDEVSVTSLTGPWEAVVHYHPNPHVAHQLRLPSSADIFTRQNHARAFGRGERVREFVEFTIPGVGRGRIEYGIDPTHEQPFYIRIFQEGEAPAIRRFSGEDEYSAFWSDHDDMYVEPGSPLYRQLEAALEDEFDYRLYEPPPERSAADSGDTAPGARGTPEEDTAPSTDAATDRSVSAPETSPETDPAERTMAGRGRTPPRTTTPSTVPLMDAAGQLTDDGIAYILTHYGEYEITPSFLGRRTRVDSLTPEQIRQEFNNRAGWLEEVIRAERLGSFTTTRPDIDFTLPRETQMRSFARLFQEALDREGAGRQLDLSVLSENTGTYIQTLVAAGDPVVAPYHQQCEALARTDPAFRREWNNFLWGNQRSGSAGRRGPSGDAGSAFMLGVNGFRKLDMADVLVSADTVRVADASFAYLSPIHNFKTAYYRSLIERLMPGFTVTAEDIRSATRRRRL